MPPVKRLLPPRSSAEAFSSTSTCAPASHAARAAVRAALPAPTTTTSLNSSGSSTLSLRLTCLAAAARCIPSCVGYGLIAFLLPQFTTLSLEQSSIVLLVNRHNAWPCACDFLLPGLCEWRVGSP